MVHREGFSLVELSIVLVILGLLTGGILTGQNLIRAAELRSVTTEYQAYQTAVRTFQDKYFYLPGDMPNATDFWGAMTSGTCPHATSGTGTQTCNGNGNGEIRHGSGAADQTNERFTFWQHLANAGLIEGYYTGIAGSSGVDDHDMDVNAPSGRLSNGGWSVNFLGDQAGDTALFDGSYGNSIWIGAPFTSYTHNESILTAEELWNIDTKIDDGKPAHGNVVPLSRNNCTSATNAAGDSDNFDATYNLSDTSIACVPLFRNAF